MVDKDGILWAGTPGSGLAIFNGSTWQICNTKTSMLPHDSVLSINQDYNGSIWIGTAKGLVRVQNSVWSVFKKESTVTGDNRITGIACTKNGNKWFSSGYGCLMYDNTTWHQMVMIGSIGLRAIHAVAADRNDYVSWACEYGLFQSDPIDSLHKYIPIFDDNATYTEITDIAIDKKNVRWMASTKGIISYTGSAWKLYTVANSGLPSNSISSVAVDHNDAVWAGIKAGSSVIKISNSIKVYYPDNAVVLKDAGTVNDISVDRKNSIYFATEKGGLIQLTFISVPE
jgi:ligand-binding sensor domain-containing protein